MVNHLLCYHLGEYQFTFSRHLKEIEDSQTSGQCMWLERWVSARLGIVVNSPELVIGIFIL